MTHQPPQIDLMGVRIHAVTEQECVQQVFDRMDGGLGGWVVTPNLDHVRRFTRSPEFRELYAQCSLTVADGMPLVWASKFQGSPLPERVTGSNLIWSLSEEAAKRGRSLYLFGGDPGTADEAARVLQEHYPGLPIAGTDCPEFGFEKRPEDLARATDKIRDSKADLVLVALGSPKQEVVIGEIRNSLPEAWWIGVGISFSFVTGAVHRAPLWMQRLGIEWVHRLAQEPRRLARRYLIEDLPFALRLLFDSARKRIRRSPADQ